MISWLGGCNGWKTADWSPLLGREVIIWPDCDTQRKKLSKKDQDAGLSADDMPYLPWLEQPGMKASLGIAEKLEELECAVKIVPVPPPGDWPSGYDIADVIQDTEPLASVAEMLEKAEAFPAPFGRAYLKKSKLPMEIANLSCRATVSSWRMSAPKPTAARKSY